MELPYDMLRAWRFSIGEMVALDMPVWFEVLRILPAESSWRWYDGAPRAVTVASSSGLKASSVIPGGGSGLKYSILLGVGVSLIVVPAMDAREKTSCAAEWSSLFFRC